MRAHGSGMGQVFSSAESKKKRRRRGKKKDQRFWKRIWSSISPVFGRNPTQKQIPEVAKFDSDNHSHIVCEHEKHKFASMMSFLGGKDLLKSINVPGKEKTQMKVTQEVLRRVLIGMFVRFQHMHSEGKTLEGCFEAVNLFVPVQDVIITPYIQVKLDFLPKEAFKSYTDERGDKDLMQLGWIAEHVILSSETELPTDLTQLFELLRAEPIKNRDLIYSHVSLKKPREKVSHFMWWYKRLLYLKKKERVKYENIMKKINSAAEKWRSEAKENKFLARFRPFSSSCKKGGYAGDGKGLVRFYRNVVEHLLKMFDDDEPNSDPKPETQASTAEEDEDELDDYHIPIVLTEAFPKFLGDLQKALHEEGELERFNTEDPSPIQNVIPAVATSQC